MSYFLSKHTLTPKGVLYKRGFSDLYKAFEDLFSSSGSFDPPRYPHDARQQDLMRIGQDMRRAMNQYDEKTEKRS